MIDEIKKYFTNLCNRICYIICFLNLPKHFLQHWKNACLTKTNNSKLREIKFTFRNRSWFMWKWDQHYVGIINCYIGIRNSHKGVTISCVGLTKWRRFARLFQAWWSWLEWVISYRADRLAVETPLDRQTHFNRNSYILMKVSSAKWRPFSLGLSRLMWQASSLLLLQHA